MTGEAELVRLLHRADWTRLSLSAQVSDGSTLVVAPGKRYRLEAADYVRGCDGARPWELSDEDDDDDDGDNDGEVHWISGPEPPLRDLLSPAWLLTGSRLEVRGRVRACGRDALDIVVTARPSFHHRVASDLRHGPVEAVVDAELGILLRVVQPGYGRQPETTEFVTADFEPDIDPAQFRPPPGSLRAESFGEAMGGGGLAWRATKTAAGLAAGGLGALIKHGPRPPNRPAPEDGFDIEPAIPLQDPTPQVSADGLPMGAPVSDDLLNLLHAGGPGAFTATMHDWIDASALASRVPESARRTGFGGLGYLMEALSEQTGATRMTSTLRIAGPRHYQIDRSHQPRHGPVTIACDGQRCWQVYADKTTTGPAEPPPFEIGELADPSWLLQCWLADGTSVLASGRPAYRISVTRRNDYPSFSFSMVFPTAVAVVDAELGCIVRLTSYVGGEPVSKYELQHLARASAAFQIDVPADLPVTEAGPFDGISSARPPHPPSLPVTLGKIVARHAATEAARAGRNLLGRLGPRDPA